MVGKLGFGESRSMKTNRLVGGASGWRVLTFLACGLMVSIAQAGWDPGAGIKAGRLRLSPFADISVGYDSNVRLSEGEITETQVSEEGDFFSRFSAGLGIGRVLESELDLRLRFLYDTRQYADETDSNSDNFTTEASARYWPASDKYMVSAGLKYREIQDSERVPPSAALTMPGELPLPYLEERSDRLKRTGMDAFANASLLALSRTDLSIGATASSVDYNDRGLFDYVDWGVNGSAGYRFTEKTSFFGVMEYSMEDGDGLSDPLPVYSFRLGFRTRPREKLDYSISAGATAYRSFDDATGQSKSDTVSPDFDGRLNWRYSEKLNFFGKAWTDVTPAVQQAENTRRSYSGQLGAGYAFMKRLTASGAVSYRLDDYDFPVEYESGQAQEQAELWQVTGRLVLAPRANAFWNTYVEASYEQGDNDLDDYDQWIVWLGASVWY